MKQSIKYITTLIALVVFTFFVTPQVFGQAGPPPPPQSGNDPANGGAPPVPIDGGISLLLAAGAALGGKKLYDLNKSKGDQDT